MAQGVTHPWLSKHASYVQYTSITPVQLSQLRHQVADKSGPTAASCLLAPAAEGVVSCPVSRCSQPG